MVKILLIIPYLGVKEQFEYLVSLIDEKDIMIETTHIYGTAHDLIRDSDADIVIARGLTGAAFKKLRPHKQLVGITMTSFDIMDAIARCRAKYAPGRIVLCLNDSANVDVGSIEELSGVSIKLYDVKDEDDISHAIDEGLANGAEVFVGGLTLCQKCDALGLHRTHIKTSQASIERAITEALNAARTLNQERAKINVIEAVLNNSSESMVLVGKKGNIMAVNNQARLLYRISTGEDLIDRQVDSLFPDAGWAEALRTGAENDKLQYFFDKLYYVRCKPIMVDKQGAGVLITTQNTASITETETKIRKGLSEKGLVAKYTFDNIIGTSEAMRYNISVAHKYAAVDSNVLVVGETGTGKELFAHSIHNASRRRDKPFVAVNCAALPENLLESELFGYVEGAFSGAVKGGKAGLFELAHKGTIFLDEIGEIPIALQAKLLRALQEKEIRRVGGDKVMPIDARVISATNIDLEKQIAAGTFRADLYYRLNLLGVRIPPLRERTEDIPPLVDYFLSHYAARSQRTPPVLSREALAMLCGYSMPGNARELRNICERFVVLGEGGTVTGEDVVRMALSPAAFPQRVKAAEREAPGGAEHTEARNRKKQKTKEQQALELGVSRTTLWRRMKQKSGMKQANETDETK